jgi:hypothetical protein
VLLSGVQPSVHAALERSGLVEEIGEMKIWSHLEEALAAARDLLAEMRASGGRVPSAPPA